MRAIDAIFFVVVTISQFYVVFFPKFRWHMEGLRPPSLVFLITGFVFGFISIEKITKTNVVVPMMYGIWSVVAIFAGVIFVIQYRKIKPAKYTSRDL